MKGILKENERRIKLTNNNREEIDKLMLIYMELKKQEMIISKELGVIIQGYRT